MENQNKTVKKIMEQYQEKEVTKLDELKALDKKAKKGANIFAYVFGVIGSLVLGTGMCIAMEVILEGYMLIGILVGLVGIAMVSLNYFIYKNKLQKSKNKYAQEIITKSKELLNE